MSHILVLQFVIDSIRANHHKIVLFAIDLEISNFWFGYEDFWVTVIF